MTRKVFLLPSWPGYAGKVLLTPVIAIDIVETLTSRLEKLGDF
jgi:hypothetical protein